MLPLSDPFTAPVVGSSSPSRYCSRVCSEELNLTRLDRPFLAPLRPHARQDSDRTTTIQLMCLSWPFVLLFIIGIVMQNFQSAFFFFMKSFLIFQLDLILPISYPTRSTVLCCRYDLRQQGPHTAEHAPSLANQPDIPRVFYDTHNLLSQSQLFLMHPRNFVQVLIEDIFSMANSDSTFRTVFIGSIHTTITTAVDRCNCNLYIMMLHHASHRSLVIGS